MVVVLPYRRRWWWRGCRRNAPSLLLAAAAAAAAVLLLLSLLQWPAFLELVVSVLSTFALMPPAADMLTATVVAGGTGRGSRVRETKRTLLSQQNRSGGVGGSRPWSRFPSLATAVTAGVAVVPRPVVAKGTVSKITEKFQVRSPPSRTCLSRTQQQRSGRDGNAPSLPPPPPAVIKHDIKRRQEKLLNELHRRTTAAAVAVCVRPPPVDGAGGDSGSSSDSEKSVAIVDKPGSPHSSGYESVDESTAAAAVDGFAAVAVPYSWVFGGSSDDDDVTTPSVAAVAVATPEDRLGRLVTFAPVTSCPALTRAKPDQDDDDDDESPAAVRRHFVGNDVATTCSAGGSGGGCGYLSPIPECSSAEPNSVETVDDEVYLPIPRLQQTVCITFRVAVVVYD